MPPQVRIAWADVARGIAIALVVFGHVWRGLEGANLIGNPGLFLMVDRAIYLFHMPLFFFLSGMFVRAPDGFNGFVRQTVRRSKLYLYPLLIWSWINVSVRLLAGDAANRAPPSLVDILLYPCPPKDIFWFLWALFLIQIAVAAASLLPVRYHRLFGVGAGVASIAYIAGGANVGLIDAAVRHLPFFLLGIALSKGLTTARFPALLALAAFIAAESLPSCRAMTCAVCPWSPSALSRCLDLRERLQG